MEVLGIILKKENNINKICPEIYLYFSFKLEEKYCSDRCMINTGGKLMCFV